MEVYGTSLKRTKRKRLKRGRKKGKEKGAT
jgi:hypothetical protein